MKRMLFGLLCLLTPSFLIGPADAQTPAPRPNIVFIIADDLGWSDVAFHGGNAPTPHLDRLADTGLELEAHYVAPVCSPTRAGLLTGRCWSRFGVVNPQNNQALPSGTLTLASALRQAGYQTCLTGKWHLGSRPEEGPNHFGFDHSYGSLAGGVTAWTHRYKSGPYSHTWHRNETLLDASGHVTDLITDEAIAWLKERQTAPFFLYVPFTAVHLPVDEPQPWLDRVPDTIEGEVARHYAASIMHLDDSVGRILSTLEAIGKRDNTLVVFTSDNGGSTAENRDTKYPNNDAPKGRLPGNNRPLRGQKGSVYEGGTRVPTIVAWPNKVKPGRVSAPVQIIDWMPTCCALADFTPTSDPHWDGIDLTALLTEHQSPAVRALYCAGPGFRARSLRFGKWKLVVSSSKAGNEVELFDLATDPSETKNLATDFPARVEDLSQRLQAMQQADNNAKVTSR